MDRNILGDVFAFISIIVGMGCLTGVLVTHLKRRDRQIVNTTVADRLDQIADRLDRLDGAIDTMAVEVERISEAQRFTAKVLADRHGAPSLPDKQRGTITPH